MDIQEADLFRALGNPDGVGAGFICRGANMVRGAELHGQHLGARCMSTITNDIEVFETGVYAVGDNFGVYGQSAERVPALGPKAGVIGNSRQAFGVVGLSSQLGGVFGRSDKFAGVFGSSSQSVGVGGRSDRSHGVFGITFAPIVPGTNPRCRCKPISSCRAR